MNTLFQRFAQTMTCREDLKQDKLDVLMVNAPSGSGFDNGTTFEEELSTKNKLVFSTSFHHMNDDGYYAGWTEHKIIIVPSLAHEYDMRITGRDKNMIKDYIGDVFTNWLNSETNN